MGSGLGVYNRRGMRILSNLGRGAFAGSPVAPSLFTLTKEGQGGMLLFIPYLASNLRPPTSRTIVKEQHFRPPSRERIPSSS